MAVVDAPICPPFPTPPLPTLFLKAERLALDGSGGNWDLGLDLLTKMLSRPFLPLLKQLAKSSLLEHKIATMKQEQKSWEQQSENLKSQLVTSQEKVCRQLSLHFRD